MPYDKGAAPTPAEFRLVADSVPHIMWMAAPDGTTECFNQSGLRYAGVPADGDEPVDWVTLLHPDDADQARLEWQAAMAAPTAQPFSFEGRIRRVDGEYRWHEIDSVPLLADNGDMVTWIGTATDVEDGFRYRSDGPGALHGLSPRQVEVLALLGSGADTEQIARELFISHNTVRNHIQRIIRALGVHSRLEAVTVAIREGIIDSPSP